MSHLKLIYHPLCPPCRFVLMVADAIKLKIPLEEVDILTSKYLCRISQINPLHTVPTLKDSDLTIWESHAIAPYLIANYSKDDALYPKEVKLRATIDQYLHFDTGLLFPILKKIINPILFRNQFGITREHVKDIDSAYSFTNRFLGAGKWLCGDVMTLADLACVSTLSTLDLLYPVKAKNYPNLYRFIRTCEQLPCYEKYNAPGLDQTAHEIHYRLIYRKKLKYTV